MSHYSIGYTDYNHRGVKIRSIVGNTQADDFVTNLDTTNLEQGFIPPDYENRPERIAEVFYGDPRYYWYVCLTSGKFDVFKDFKTGNRVVLPDE